MPVKILLADKSITIQKVVEMLFSGKEYEVVSVSDGEAALREAERIVPDVVLADVDLPRLDGYSFATRLKQLASTAKTPVILMMSRDDVLDAAKAQQAAITDHIAKPFESQDLIGKVKKAIGSMPARPAEPESQRTAAAKNARLPEPAVSAPSAPPKQPARPKQSPAADIFDIIKEAPSSADLARATPSMATEESVYEVEPVVEVEEPAAREMERALPIGRKAMEEMRAGLGLAEDTETLEPEIVNFESVAMASGSFAEKMKARPQAARPEQAPHISSMPEAREYIPPPPEPETALGSPVSEERLQRIAEEAASRAAHQYFNKMAIQPPKISEETIRRGIEDAVSKIAREIAREVIEKVAWEVIPDLAEMLIKAEIERLKAET